MRLLPTTFILLGALCVDAQPANQGDILACLQIVPGANATQTLEENGLQPPTDPDLFVAYYCEPLPPGIPCYETNPRGLTCFRPYCVCCKTEELIEDFTGFVGVDCRVLPIPGP